MHFNSVFPGDLEIHKPIKLYGCTIIYFIVPHGRQLTCIVVHSYHTKCVKCHSNADIHRVGGRRSEKVTLKPSISMFVRSYFNLYQTV